MNIRVVEIGGTHIRRAEIENEQISRLQTHRTREILHNDILAALQGFSLAEMPTNIQAIVFLVAGPVKATTVLKMPNFPEFPTNTDLNVLDLGKQVLVYNDMTAAVCGMAELLKKENIDRPFWGLTWSTGLGGKYWDGNKISIDREIGHEIFLQGLEAEKLLGGRFLAEEAGKSLETVTAEFIRGDESARHFYLEKAAIMGEFLDQINEIDPSNLFVFKGSIAKNLFASNEIRQVIINKIRKKDRIDLLLSPDPDKDSFIGAETLAKKAVSQ